MAYSTRHDRRVQAEEAVDRAMADDLVKLRSYSLLRNNGQFRIGVPPEGPNNLLIQKGDEATAYVDFENGFLVYDLNGGDVCGEER